MFLKLVSENIENDDITASHMQDIMADNYQEEEH